MPRLFFAVWPDAECARALETLAPSLAEGAQGKPVPGEKVHMTLAFLGEIEADRRLAAIEAAQGLHADSFVLRLDRVGTFQRARVVWAGTSEPPKPLLRLQSELERRLRALGFALEDRPFKPHVTLARKTSRTMPLASIAPIEWRVEAFTLVRSLGGTGRYAVEERWDLGI